MQYAIRAVRRMQPASLVLEAASADEARRQAEADGYAVVSVAGARRGVRLGLARGASFPLLQFNQSLLILIRAGLSVVEAIETLAEREARADVRGVIARLHEAMKEGRSFSTALAAQPASFPALYVAGVRANEKTGAIADSIERFVAYRAQSELVRKRVVAASIYPVLVLAVGALVIAFLLFYVVPRFAVVFEDLGDRIPLLSRLLLEWGRFAHDHALQLLVSMALAVAALVFGLRRPAARAWIATRVQRLPTIGEYVRVYQLARFYRALGMLQQAGVPIVAALDMATGLLPPSLHPALAAARRDIGEGRAVSAAFERNGLTTVVSLRLLRIAERSGRMGEMLERAATFHDDDIAQAVDWFIRVFEPMLMIAIGIVIGIVVLLMYAPIFELAGSLQ